MEYFIIASKRSHKYFIMFGRIASTKALPQTRVAARNFRTSAVAAANKKPSIGDAVTILQSKVSGINQVVSRQIPRDFSRTKINRNLSCNPSRKTLFVVHASIGSFVH